MANDVAPSPHARASTPLWWRLALAGTVIALLGLSALFRSSLPAQVQSLLGFISLLGVAATFSANLRAVNWRTIGVGLLLQLTLALFILKLQIGSYQPGQILFQKLGQGISKFLELSNEGSKVVFGPLINAPAIEKGLKLNPGEGFIFAFTALPTIIFVSCFFAVLYYLGVLQFIVKVLARAMMFLMGTSGAETLSSAANVFMGQTEAPLIVRPYVKGMTQSELLALMAGGMATVSGGMLAVYASPGIGASPVALLATSVMAAPCGLYLSKLVLPETEEPQTRGTVKIDVETPYRNVIDAAAGGVTDGLKLALNVGAMLIAFIAMVALINAVLTQIDPNLTLENIFARLFWPLAMAMGVEGKDTSNVAKLLGMKLSINELFAFTQMKKMGLAPRSQLLVTYALNGFANLGSIGILLGGIGAMAPERRSDIARLGLRALFVGFMATLLNACLAGTLISG